MLNATKEERGERAMEKSILIIDDEIAFLLPMKKMLQGPGISVDIAETYNQAMDLLGNKHFDVVIADIRLSGILGKEGLEILRFIKSTFKDTKVIIITGYGNQEVMQNAFSEHAEFYFEKPVPVSVISEALRQLEVAV